LIVCLSITFGVLKQSNPDVLLPEITSINDKMVLTEISYNLNIVANEIRSQNGTLLAKDQI